MVTSSGGVCFSTSDDGFVDYLGDFGFFEAQRERPGEIEEARDQRVGAIHFARYESRHLMRHRAIGIHVLKQHFGGAFNGAQGIADFVRQSSGKLAQGRQALSAADFGLRLLQIAVGFR